MTENQRIQGEFLRMLPRIRRVVRHNWPKMKRAKLRLSFYEFQHDVITMCFRDFQRLCASGRESRAFATPLATFACKQVNSGRNICSARGWTDALDHVEYVGAAGIDYDVSARLTKQNVHLDTKDDSQAGAPESSAADWQDYLTPDGRLNPADGAQTHLDFVDYLATLTPRLCAIAVALASGYSPSFVASMFGLSRGRISQFRDKLRSLWNSRVD